MAEPQQRELLFRLHAIRNQDAAVIVHTEDIGEDIQLNRNHCRPSP